MEMKCLLYIGQLLCLICTLAHSKFIQKMYTKTKGSNNGIFKEFHILDGPGQTLCASACLQSTTSCESFSYDETSGVCKLQKNGYGSWMGGKRNTLYYICVQVILQSSYPKCSISKFALERI